jgi:hypothetical protein
LIESDLEVIQKQLARLPTRQELGARPSNSQQAEVLEFYCRLPHQAGVIQQFFPVECIILSSSELPGRAPREDRARHHLRHDDADDAELAVLSALGGKI